MSLDDEIRAWDDLVASLPPCGAIVYGCAPTCRESWTLIHELMDLQVQEGPAIQDWVLRDPSWSEAPHSVQALLLGTNWPETTFVSVQTGDPTWVILMWRFHVWYVAHATLLVGQQNGPQLRHTGRMLTLGIRNDLAPTIHSVLGIS